MLAPLQEAVNANYRHGFTPLAIRRNSKRPAVDAWEQWQHRPGWRSGDTLRACPNCGRRGRTADFPVIREARAST